MSPWRFAPSLLGLVLAVGLAPHVTQAEEDPAGHERKADPTRELALPFRDLAFDPAMRITEGPRMLGDEFPYLAAAPRKVSGARAVEIVPETLRSFLRAAPQKGVASSARVRTGEAAIEAVRMFLAGPIISDAKTAERLIETGRDLAGRLEHLDLDVTAHRPEAWAPRARPVYRDEARTSIKAWTVSVVAFELDRMLRLVHVTAKVGVDGQLAIHRKPIVNGPMTIWQTAAIGEYTDEIVRRDEAMRAEAVTARRTYARALRPAHTLDTFWAAGRVLHDMRDVRALFGEPDRDIGSGIHIWTYDLEDGTSVVFGAGRERVVYIRHVRGARRPMKGFETLGTIYAWPGR